MPIPWNQEYSVGVKEIDLQHQHFIGILNRLYQISGKQEDLSEIQSTLDDLTSYADFHFKTEEKYFDLFEYKEAAEHKEKHRELFSKVSGFLDQFRSGKHDILFELIDFLEDWLVEHLATEDKKYSDCFHAHGLS
jgi:hemerythrin